MANIGEHEHTIGTDYGGIDAYIAGTGDPGTDEWRLSFVQPTSTITVDMRPTELAKLAFWIQEALHDEGFCEHGVPFDGSPCADCDEAMAIDPEDRE